MSKVNENGDAVSVYFALFLRSWQPEGTEYVRQKVRQKTISTYPDPEMFQVRTRRLTCI